MLTAIFLYLIDLSVLTYSSLKIKGSLFYLSVKQHVHQDIKRHATEIQTDTLLCVIESHDQGMVKVLAATPIAVLCLVSFIKSYEFVT